MYVFLALHFLFLAIIITNAALPAQATYWMNDLASTIINKISDAIHGTKPAYPTNISIDNYSRTFLSYYYNDDSKYHILEGEAFYVHINLEFPKGSKENLKYKDLTLRASEGAGTDFTSEYDKEQGRLAIYGLKASSNNYVTLTTPNNMTATINFDVVSKVIPEKENIYISNAEAKIGSSFFIDSLYLECYEDRILADDYSVSDFEDLINGGVYYSNLARNTFYYQSLSESSIYKYINLDNHQYQSDDEHLVIDEEAGVVSVLNGVRIGEHTITSSFGGEVHFTVTSEHVSPITVSELTIKSTEGYANPNQFNTGYKGQTILLNDIDILKDHAFSVKSTNESVAYANIKKHLYGGVYNNNGEILVRGRTAGECDVVVSLYQNQDIKLNHHVRCDTMENLFNYRVACFIDDEEYKGETLEAFKAYKLDIKIFNKTTEEFIDPTSITFANYNDIYTFEIIDGNRYITFKTEKNTVLQFDYVYIEDYLLTYKQAFSVVNNEKGIYSNVSPVNVRKIVGHGMLHFMCTLFLILFLLVYFKGHKFKYFSFIFATVSSFVVACLTELIQLMIPGRDGTFKDVFFDYIFSIGALLIVGLVVLIIYLIKKHKDKKKE